MYVSNMIRMYLGYHTYKREASEMGGVEKDLSMYFKYANLLGYNVFRPNYTKFSPYVSQDTCILMHQNLQYCNL